MRQFDFYEFAGVIVPGATLLLGIAMCVPVVKDIVFNPALSIGGATLSLVVAYGLGHLIQAAGNGIEKILWWTRGGWPSDWPRSRRNHLLSDGQVAELDRCVVTTFKLDAPGELQKLSAEDWSPIVRQVYAAVSACDRAERVDTFNGNYGLNRGLAAAMAAITVLAFVTHGSAAWKATILLAIGTALAVYRMHRFGVHYARELFVQFLSVTNNRMESHRNE